MLESELRLELGDSNEEHSHLNHQARFPLRNFHEDSEVPLY